MKPPLPHGVKDTPQIRENAQAYVEHRKPRQLDTGELGPVSVSTPSYRETQAKMVREALEAAAKAEPDPKVTEAMMFTAYVASTETLAYLARLLKG